MVAGDLATAVDVVVLGAGPGGYVAAIRAAQLGKEVVLVDPDPPGGTCLHQGCIPSKALLTAADHAWRMPALAELGIAVGEPRLDLAQMQVWKNGLVQQLGAGVKKLLAAYQIETMAGRGWFIGEREVRVEAEYGTKRFNFDQCVIAVGARPAPLPELGFDGRRVLTPYQALNLTELPKCLAIIGAGYIAAELATLFAKLGVTVRLLLPAGQPLLSEFDPSAGRQVRARLKKLGVNIEPNGATVEAESQIVVAVGLLPCTGGLHLAQAKVETDASGFIRVNDRMQTSNQAVYAVGDVTGGPPLASVAIKQGKIAAEAIAGLPVQYAPQAIPRVAWTDPEVAAVGLTAAEATAAGYKVVTGRFPLAANGRALTLDDKDGFVLTVAEQESGVLLGITLVGQDAEMLIGEAALALEMGATLTDLSETLHPHPGLGEALQES
ncbi:MAG: FAD-dependent oxidoreductase, partial [Chloroflexota bacterium]